MRSSEGAAGPRRLRILVVDDSAVVRQVVRASLEQLGGMEVVVAADPLFAQEEMRQRRPDVILLDLEMPRMDGLTFLRALMTEPQPVPVVVCSGHAGDGSRAAMEALDAGAVDIVAKPSFAVRSFLEGAGAALAETVRAAAGARPRARGMHRGAVPRREATAAVVRPRVHECEVVAIGASTGGVDALCDLLRALPRDVPGLVIAQHMPAEFTGAFAERLHTLSRLEVREAAAGDELRPGVALLAPGGRHLTVERRDGRLVTRLDAAALDARHRPSVDVLFRSVAGSAGARAAGVLLTGMGSDGADGMLALRRAGALTIAQDEASCVVFGMPRAAIESGAAREVASLRAIGERIATL